MHSFCESAVFSLFLQGLESTEKNSVFSVVSCFSLWLAVSGGGYWVINLSLQRQSVASDRNAMAIDMKQAASTPGQPQAFHKNPGRKAPALPPM